MPNQRKKGQMFVGAWIKDDLKSKLNAIAKAMRKSQSAVLKELLEQFVGKSSKVSLIREHPNVKAASPLKMLDHDLSAGAEEQSEPKAPGPVTGKARGGKRVERR